MTERVFLGIDLGGTFIKGMLLSADGARVANGSRPTGRSGADAVVGGMLDLARELTAGHSLAGIGVAMPGVVEMTTGQVKFLPNVSGNWEGRPVAAELSAALDAPASLMNDVRAATYGELHFGAGRGVRDLVMVAVGTGIGGGIVSDGKLVTGGGHAGEVGHMAIEMRGPRCSCGGWGCAEALVSGKALTADGRALLERGESPGLERLTNGDHDRVTPRMIAEAAVEGDPAARRLMDEAGFRLGILLSNLVLLLNPARVILGGGVALAGRPLYDGIDRTMQERIGWYLRHTSVEVVPAELGEEAGALGAAAWAWKNSEA